MEAATIGFSQSSKTSRIHSVPIAVRAPSTMS